MGNNIFGVNYHGVNGELEKCKKPVINIPDPPLLKTHPQYSRTMCTQFSVASAIANNLYVRHKIEVDIDQTMAALMQTLPITSNDVDSVSPLFHKKRHLLLQGLQNGNYRPTDTSRVEPKFSWKVYCKVKEVEKEIFRENKILDDKKEYVVEYSRKLHKRFPFQKEKFDENENWSKWGKWKKYNDRTLNPDDNKRPHCAYIKKQYNSLNSKHQRKAQKKRKRDPSKEEKLQLKKSARKTVFDCVNMWGFRDICPVIECDSPAIKSVYEISIRKQKIQMT